MKKSRRLKFFLVFFAVLGASQASQAAFNVTNDANANAIIADMGSEIEDNSSYRLSNLRINRSADLLMREDANIERLLFQSSDNDSMGWAFSRKPRVDYKALDYASWTSSSAFGVNTQGRQWAEDPGKKSATFVEFAITDFPQLNMLGNSYLANISQLQSTSKATVTDSLPRPSTIILVSLGTLLAMSSRKLILNVSKI